MNKPMIWALLGDKTGDNNQLLALADRLGLPFEKKQLSYNLLRAIPPRFLGASLRTLTANARCQIAPPWPDLVIAIGRRSVPTARWLRKHHGSKLVLMGHPRVDPALFDVVVTTRQYPVPAHPNVILLPMPMSRLGDREEQTERESALLKSLPRPHLLLALGGPTKYWELDGTEIETAVDKLISRAGGLGGSLIAIGSRRTPVSILAAIRSRLPSPHRLIDDSEIRFSTLLHDADEIFVTADSISMLSEAVQTGKKVGMVPIQMTDKGRRLLGGSSGSTPHRRRDLRQIWRYLETEGLVGTVSQPRAGNWSSHAVSEASTAVRRLMGLDQPLG